MESKSVEFEELVGDHILMGVDIETSDATAIRFVLDGKRYSVWENEDDGYRSSMGSFEVDYGPVLNMFPMVPVEVVRNARSRDTLSIIDKIAKKEIIEVGTDCSDDYYPSFVCEYNPQHMSINLKQETTMSNDVGLIQFMLPSELTHAIKGLERDYLDAIALQAMYQADYEKSVKLEKERYQAYLDVLAQREVITKNITDVTKSVVEAQAKLTNAYRVRESRKD